MANQEKPEGKSDVQCGCFDVMGRLRILMRLSMCSVVLVLLVSGITTAKDLPNAPSAVATHDTFFLEPSNNLKSAPGVVPAKTIDLKFLSLAAISTGSTFSDSYTTLFARENWLAGKHGVCNAEGQSPYLYGTHPTVARAYAVASAKSVGAILAAYYLRKHHSKFWSAPLIGNSIISLSGVTQNMMICN